MWVVIRSSFAQSLDEKRDLSRPLKKTLTKRLLGDTMAMRSIRDTEPFDLSNSIKRQESVIFTKGTWLVIVGFPPVNA